MKYGKYMRKVVRELTLYKRQSLGRLAEFEEPLLLDTNENFFISAAWQKRILRSALESMDVRRYPVPYSASLSEHIADFLKVEDSAVVVGNGADEVIDIVIRTFVEPGDEVIVTDPTFRQYEFSVKLADGVVRPVSLKENFDLDVERLLASIEERTKPIFLCSPNNPTGNQFLKADIRRVLEESGRVVVVDEAYVHFARDSVLDLLNDYENLMVLRTFSKAYGLAGLRIGFVVLSKEIGEYLRRVQQHYSVSLFAQKAVEAFLRSWDYVAEKIEEIKKERQRLSSKLSEIEGLKPFPSEANFILTRTEKRGCSSGLVQERLTDAGIFIKNIGQERLCENCIRVTVGTPRMNNRLLAELRSILG